MPPFFPWMPRCYYPEPYFLRFTKRASASLPAASWSRGHKRPCQATPLVYTGFIPLSTGLVDHQVQDLKNSHVSQFCSIFRILKSELILAEVGIDRRLSSPESSPQAFKEIFIKSLRNQKQQIQRTKQSRSHACCEPQSEPIQDSVDLGTKVEAPSRSSSSISPRWWCRRLPGRNTRQLANWQKVFSAFWCKM